MNFAWNMSKDGDGHATAMGNFYCVQKKMRSIEFDSNVIPIEHSGILRERKTSPVIICN